MKIKSSIIFILLTVFVCTYGAEHVALRKDLKGINYKENPNPDPAQFTVSLKMIFPEMFKVEETTEEVTEKDSVMTTTSGYRVQVYKTEKIEQAKNQELYYADIFGDDQVYLIFESPFYKIRVGNFRSRNEAEDFILSSRKIRSDRSIIVPDKINIIAPGE